MKATGPWRIVGQGLAGTCLAWELWWRGEPFCLVDREQGGSSRVAAGLVNPVTGRNFEPSWRIVGFLAEALSFYARVAGPLALDVWEPRPILRLAASGEEWAKIQVKRARPEVARWVDPVEPVVPPGWVGAAAIRGGGRLKTREFLDASREYFRASGNYRQEMDEDGGERSRTVYCDGAAGLLAGRVAPHRCAKGEILTVRAQGWDEQTIRVGAGGWLVPLGGGFFKVGATYQWDVLDEVPGDAGRKHLLGTACRLGGQHFEVVGHEAGIRPILRRSQPVIGPLADGGWIFNGLGSKGSLYAPGVARRLAAWLVDGVEPEAELDLRVFTGHQRP